VLEQVVPFLVCPYCGKPTTKTNDSLRCSSGHVFDIARQGYVSLLPAGWRGDAGDTAAMLDARRRFQAAGHLGPLAAKLADVAEQQVPAGPGCIVDVGAGTGYFVAAVLERFPDRVGLALDVSKYAVRRAARAHDRVGAAACDVWHGLPVATNSAALVLNVFAPRNAAEMARIMHPSGRLLVATPTSQHLDPLVSALDLLMVDELKPQRLAAQLGTHFEQLDRHSVTATMSLTRREMEAVVAMGPSAWHTNATEVRERIRRLPEPTSVTLSVMVGVYQPLG
jgi:23S rRNA (guanine745-N1)-methyltransferase